MKNSKLYSWLILALKWIAFTMVITIADAVFDSIMGRASMKFNLVNLMRVCAPGFGFLTAYFFLNYHKKSNVVISLVISLVFLMFFSFNALGKWYNPGTVLIISLCFSFMPGLLYSFVDKKEGLLIMAVNSTVIAVIMMLATGINIAVISFGYILCGGGALIVYGFPVTWKLLKLLFKPADYVTENAASKQ